MQLPTYSPANGLRPAVSSERLVGAGILTLELLVLGALAWQTARLVWAIVTPATPLGNWQPVSFSPVATDRTVMGSFDPFFRKAVSDETAVSSLSLLLLGTRVDTVSGRGAAIIGTPDGVQTSFAVGDTIQPGVTLTAVSFDSVTISRDGIPEKLFIDQSAGAPPVTPNAVGGDSVAAAGSGTQLAADVTVTPRLNGGTLTGYVLTPKGSGASFAAAGLQPGDVLVSVDGATVTSLKDAAGLTQQLDTGGINIGVERGGKLVTLRIGAK
jgi:general secretion pathway protein C